MTLDLDKVKEFVQFTREKDDLNKRLKEVQKGIDTLEEILMPQFVADNCFNIRVDGYLISIYPRIWASPVRPDDRLGVAQALRDSDLADFVALNYNSQRVQGWVNEIADSVKQQCLTEGRVFDEEALAAALPEPLRNALKVTFAHELRVTRPKPKG